MGTCNSSTINENGQEHSFKTSKFHPTKSKNPMKSQSFNLNHNIINYIQLEENNNKSNEKPNINSENPKEIDQIMASDSNSMSNNSTTSASSMGSNNASKNKKNRESNTSGGRSKSIRVAKYKKKGSFNNASYQERQDYLRETRKFNRHKRQKRYKLNGIYIRKRHDDKQQQSHDDKQQPQPQQQRYYVPQPQPQPQQHTYDNEEDDDDLQYIYGYSDDEKLDDEKLDDEKLDDKKIHIINNDNDNDNDSDFDVINGIIGREK
eukprot:477695_1